VGASLTATVSGVTSTRGAALPTQTWSFTTRPTATGKTSLLTGVTPATTAVDDSSSIELGMAFTPSVAGQVTAIRFYKGTGNTGTHTGSLWTADGTRLATVTFTDETASGWQSATLPTPVVLSPGQTYVVSYYAPNGHFSVTGGFFANGRSSGPLTAPAANNGRYRYGWGGGFPAASWNSSNYFVDVEFEYALE
jgi:hypothetical protein